VKCPPPEPLGCVTGSRAHGRGRLRVSAFVQTGVRLGRVHSAAFI
jgi:hypothetical protein